jgi:hypothetical protein
MNRILFFATLIGALNAFSAIHLPPGGSAVVNGETVFCSGNSNTTGALTCSCNGSWGVIGEVLVSAGMSPVDECSKLSSGSTPRDCKSLSSTSGYYKCDCNGSWGTIGQVTVSSGKSVVDECRKLSAGSFPRSCTAL